MPLVAWLLLPAPPSITPQPRSRPARVEQPAPFAAPPVEVAARAQPAAAARADGPGEGVAGEVQDPDGKPLGHALITCMLGERAIDGASDEAGHFQLGADAAGCLAVAHKTHFGPSAEVPLRAGAANQLRLTPPMGIAGNVVDESGAPVMAYQLAIDSFQPAGGAPDGGAARPRPLDVEDADGAFEWTELAAGRYTLGVGVRFGPLARSQVVEVTPGGMSRGVRIVTHPGVTVTGMVTDAVTHAPIDGAFAFVVLGTIETRRGNSHDGIFKVEGAPAGPFDLHVFCFGYVEQILRGLQGRPGGEPLHVEVAMPKRQANAVAPPSGG